MFSNFAIRHPLRLVWRNFASLAGAEILCRVVALVAVGFYARQLQPEMFGYLSFSVAVVSYAGLLVMLGLDPVVTREVARQPELARRYVANVLSVRLLLGLGAYATLAVGVWAAAMPPLLKQVLWIEGLTLFPTGLTPAWIFHGLQQMHTVAWVRLVQSLLSAGLVLFLVRGPGGVLWVVFSNLLAGCAAGALLLFLLRRSIGPFSLTLDREFTAGLLRRSAPIALMTVGNVVYCQSGLVLMGWWRPAAELGLFGSAYRLTYGLLQPFAGMLLVAFLPALSRAYAHAPEELRGFHRGYGRLSNLCAAGILVVSALFPDVVLRLCFGATYAPAAPVLRLLACCIAASFVSGPYVAALLATRFERVLLWQTLGFGLLCLLLNLLLIPAYGAQGAAAALLVSIVAGTLSSMHFYYRHLGVQVRGAPDCPYPPGRFAPGDSAISRPDNLGKATVAETP